MPPLDVPQLYTLQPDNTVGEQRLGAKVPSPVAHASLAHACSSDSCTGVFLTALCPPVSLLICLPWRRHPG